MDVGTTFRRWLAPLIGFRSLNSCSVIEPSHWPRIKKQKLGMVMQTFQATSEPEVDGQVQSQLGLLSEDLQREVRRRSSRW